MAFQELSETKVDRLLRDDVRVGFEAQGEGFLVPLGFGWERGAMYAMTTHGRKSEPA